MKYVHTLSLLAATVALAAPVFAQSPTTSATATPAQATPKKGDLESQARISMDSAKAIALGKVPAGSTVKEAELEREKGTVVYSFDISVPGKTGVEEILVSAIDGHIVGQEHETPAHEKAEASKEKKKTP